VLRIVKKAMPLTATIFGLPLRQLLVLQVVLTYRGFPFTTAVWRPWPGLNYTCSPYSTAAMLPSPGDTQARQREGRSGGLTHEGQTCCCLEGGVKRNPCMEAGAVIGPEVGQRGRER
jgi:hypothetical protein